MPVLKKTIQVRLSAALYSRAQHAIAEADDVSSFNDLAVKAIKEELKRIEEARIDAAFSRMAKDEKYLRASAQVSDDFVTSDWETFKTSEGK